VAAVHDHIRAETLDQDLQPVRVMVAVLLDITTENDVDELTVDLHDLSSPAAGALIGLVGAA
jgi:hypothetical protein